MAGDFVDPFAERNTICHRLPAGLKLVLTLLVVVAAGVIPLRLWPLTGCLLCLVFAALSLAEIPIRYLLRRMALWLPVLVLISLSIPFSQGFSRGWGLAATILLRALTAFLAGLWLVGTTPFERLLATLARLHLPRILLMLLAFMYRYTFVLFDELARMRAAQRARTFGRRRLATIWIENTRLVATLAIRALTRAERIHDAMGARGWQGEIHLLADD